MSIGLNNLLQNICSIRGYGESYGLIGDKMGRLDPVLLEDTKIHDMLDKVSAGSSSVINMSCYGMMLISANLPYLLFMGWYLHSVNPVLIWSLLLLFIPSFAKWLLRSKIIEKFEDTAAPIRREVKFYDSTLTNREFFKETRILGGFSQMLSRLMEAYRKLSKAEWKTNKKKNLLELAMGCFTATGWGVILYLLVYSLLNGKISVGAFAAVFGSLTMVFDYIQSSFYLINFIAEGHGAGQNYVRFLDLPEHSGTKQTANIAQGISLDNVSFGYPNAESMSVDGVSLEIKQGETIAIVGENGAGKTTLVRLMIGLYRPTAGNCVVRGIDTATADFASLFGGLSGVFQKYQKYQMTLKDNIQVSELKVSGDSFQVSDGVNAVRPGTDTINAVRPGTDTINGVPTVLLSVGVDADDSETFPAGLDTMLSREFDGVDLSGGQWQRIAIARGLYRMHDIVVLDEPTAAIDPLEESRIYKMFVDISKGKTSVIVTHRLGSVKIADRVIVMRDGKIVGDAPHDELMESCSYYAEMYHAQAGWYERS